MEKFDAEFLEILKVNKVCVFCGKKPENKTVEHIIPKWLIEMTGDLNRNMRIYPVLNKKTGELEEKHLSFNGFVLPACKKCNEEFGIKEGEIKIIVEKILNDEMVSQMQVNLFLEWMDKIRVGLWLIFYFWRSNLQGIEPNYYINQRINAADRLLYIYKTDYQGNGRINFGGAQTIVFQYSPICFYLVINNYVFFNISTHTFLSKRLGFPYARKIEFTKDLKFFMTMEKGKERILHPIFNKPFVKGAVKVFQPIFYHEKSVVPEIYKNEYIYNNSLDYDLGLGKVFRDRENKIVPFEELENNYLIPQKVHTDIDLLSEIGKQTFIMQNYFIKKKVGTKFLSEERAKNYEQQIRSSVSINNLFLSLWEE